MQRSLFVGISILFYLPGELASKVKLFRQTIITNSDKYSRNDIAIL